MPDAKDKRQPMIKTPAGVVSFPNLLEAQDDPNGTPKYSVTLIFKLGYYGDDAAEVKKAKKKQDELLKPLRSAVEATLKAEFPDGKRPKNLKLPFRDGEEYEDKKGYEPGDVFVQFARKEAFGEPNTKSGFPVVGGKKDAKGKLIALDKSEIYPGMQGVVATRPYYWFHQKSGNKGVSFGLEAFQKVGEGERLGGYESVDADDTFDAVEYEEDSNSGEAEGDALSGDDGDIPFDTEE